MSVSTQATGLNGSFAPACVQLYQDCILANYCESKPLTPIKDHLGALNGACQVVDSAQLYFEQASIICPLALRLGWIVIFPFQTECLLPVAARHFKRVSV